MDTTQATLPAGSAGAQTTAPLLPRLLDAGRGSSWWGEGWRIFKASPGLWIGMLIVLLVMLGVLSFIPILGQIALVLLVPVFAGGLMLGCHALARGQPLEFNHLFAGFKDGRAGSLITLGALSMVFNLIIALILGAIVFATVGSSAFALAGTPDPDVLARLLPRMGIGLALLIPLAVILFGLESMMFWFAPALVALNRMGAWQALKTSLAGCWSNLGALMIDGLIYIGLAILASLAFGLGWLVLAPMLVGSIYAGWREVFGE
jgi:hypothetical protein